MADLAITQIPDKVKERFWSKVDKRGPLDCWPWLASKNHKGYGRFNLRHDFHTGAHRVAYVLANGSISGGLVVDHVCRKRDCCNPSHLRAITSAENVLIGVGITAVNARKQFCIVGHELAGENLVWKGGSRQCRMCRRRQNIEHGARHRQRKRAAKLAAALAKQ